MHTSRRHFLKSIPLVIGAPLLLESGNLPVRNGEVRSHSATIADSDISYKKLYEFLDGVNNDRLGLHSFIVMQEGKVVVESHWKPYTPESKHLMFSVSKSLVSLATGFAVQEGILKETDKVVSFFPDLKTDPTNKNLNAMEIRHVLSMTSGHEVDSIEKINDAKPGGRAKAYFDANVVYKPGTYFLYDSGGPVLIGMIIKKLTGQNIIEYLKSRLFNPLEIAINETELKFDAEGVDTGVFGLALRTADMAKIGQFCLQGGVWNGKPLLEKEWFNKATAAKAETKSNKNPDWQQGYGYFFWRGTHGSCRADGWGGQFCVVIPSRKIVVAITSEELRIQEVLDRLWKALEIEKGAPVGDTQNPELLSLSERLTIHRSDKKFLPENFLVNQTFETTDNSFTIKFISIHASVDTFHCQMDGSGKPITILAGRSDWSRLTGVTPGFPTLLIGTKKNNPLAGMFYWESATTLVIEIVYTDTPYTDFITVSFTSEGLEMKFKNSVSMKDASFPESRLPILAIKSK